MLKSAVRYTPLARLASLFPQLNVFAKIEYFQPTLSIKDRVARYFFSSTLDEQKLQYDAVVVPSSGNTAVALAAASKTYGKKVICTIPDDTPTSKIEMLKAFGARIELCDASVPSESPLGYYGRALSLANELERTLLFDQFSDAISWKVHYLTTGPEIWEQTSGQVDYLFAGIGTGGTITGTARFLKQMNPNLKVIAVDPLGGIFENVFRKKPYTAGEHRISGISDTFVPKVLDLGIIDDVITVSDSDAISWAQQAMLVEGLCVGTSSGCFLAGINRYIKPDEPGNVVTLLPDTGLKYPEDLFQPMLANAGTFR